MWGTSARVNYDLQCLTYSTTTEFITYTHDTCNQVINFLVSTQDTYVHTPWLVDIMEMPLHNCDRFCTVIPSTVIAVSSKSTGIDNILVSALFMLCLVYPVTSVVEVLYQGLSWLYRSIENGKSLSQSQWLGEALGYIRCYLQCRTQTPGYWPNGNLIQCRSRSRNFPSDDR